VVNFMIRPLNSRGKDKRLGGLQNRFGRSNEENKSSPCPYSYSNPSRPTHSPGTIRLNCPGFKEIDIEVNIDEHATKRKSVILS
jgi:hypothetical protein